ncbi:hypothetical protein B7486_03890 [cyanobacterium TDX16]|nr:hypothetical protein B7486_03890 [cyanobacterium TDX16]
MLSAMHRGGQGAANKAVEPVNVAAIDAELPFIDCSTPAVGRLRPAQPPLPPTARPRHVHRTS